jgi:hypothetical protein
MFGIGLQRRNRAEPSARSAYSALMQAACRQPNAQAVVNKHFHTVTKAIGKVKKRSAIPPHHRSLTRGPASFHSRRACPSVRKPIRSTRRGSSQRGPVETSRKRRRCRRINSPQWCRVREGLRCEWQAGWFLPKSRRLAFQCDKDPLHGQISVSREASLFLHQISVERVRRPTPAIKTFG